MRAFPKPDIVWRPDAPFVVDEHEISDINFQSSLTLVSLSLDDRGFYTCHATNIAGSDNETVEVIVLGESYIIRVYYATLSMS